MLFKFCKLTRRSNDKQQQGDQMPSQEENNDKKSIVGRLTRSLSMMRHRRSKSANHRGGETSNVATNKAAPASRYDDGDNISNCSSIELVRELQSGRQSRASSSLLGQLLLNNNQAEQPKQEQTERPLSLTMCDNFTFDQEVPTAAAPALAIMSNFDNCQDDDLANRIIAERRANYARRNIGAMRRLGKTDKKQESEWMFKLYDLPGSDTDKQDMSDFAKSIRKTLVSSLTPMLVETTNQMRKDAVHQQQQSEQQIAGGSAGSAAAPPTVHLHITMKPEVVATSSSSATPQDSEARADKAVTPSSNQQVDAVCVVRVSATICNEEQAPLSVSPPAVVPQEEHLSAPSSTTPAASEPPKSTMPVSNKKYFKSLQQIDDVMLQSMPAELFDNRALMKRDRRLRRHGGNQNLVDSAVQTAVPSANNSCSQPLASSMYASNYCSDDDKDVSPVFFQQQILARRQDRRQPAQQANYAQMPARAQQCRPQPHQQADLRCARVVSLNQPQQHFYHYEQDDLFSETSVIGTYEERACSIAKCMHWMSKLSDKDVVGTPSSPKNHKRTHHRQPVAHKQLATVQEQQSSPAVAIGAGEALAALPPCPCNQQHVYEYHHIHHHKHFVARV